MARIPTDKVSAFQKAMQSLGSVGTNTSMFGVAQEVIPEDALDFIPTGYPSLDYGIMTHGGFPLGRCIELYGMFSSAKSTIGARIISNAQKMGYPCALIDVERGFADKIGKDWLRTNGVNLAELMYSNQIVAEDALFEAISFIKAGFKVIMIDSVGSMVPKSLDPENTGTGAKAVEEFGKQHVAVLARALSGNLNRLAATAADHGAMVIFINQVRDKVGAMGYGDLKETPGGFAMKHAMSVRLQFANIQQIKEGEDAVGAVIKVACRKSKVCPPYRSTGKNYPNLTVYFDGRQQSSMEDLFTIAVNLGVIDRPNMRTYSYETQAGETITAVGKDKMVELLKEQNLYDEIAAMVRQATKERGNPVDVDTEMIGLGKLDNPTGSIEDDDGFDLPGED